MLVTMSKLKSVNRNCIAYMFLNPYMKFFWLSLNK